MNAGFHNNLQTGFKVWFCICPNGLSRGNHRVLCSSYIPLFDWGNCRVLCISNIPLLDSGHSRVCVVQISHYVGPLLILTGISLLSRERFTDRWILFKHSDKSQTTQTCGVFMDHFPPCCELARIPPPLKKIITQPTKQERGETLDDFELVYLFTIASEFTYGESFFLRWITSDPSPWGNFTPPMKQ